MPTLADAIADAIAELGLSRQALDAARAVLANKGTQAQTVINNFLGRPAVQTVWVDPVNGNEANDGSTAALARKSLDAVLDGVGITATQVNLMGDTLLQKMHTLYASVTILGVQPANNAGGFIYVTRRLSFLGTATNSPSAPPNNASFPSGFFVYAPNLNFQNIDFDLPIQPAGQTFKSHIIYNVGGNLFISVANLLVDAATAGTLIGSGGNTINVSATITLGAGAAGHLFERIAAAGNPNSDFGYHTNITSA